MQMDEDAWFFRAWNAPPSLWPPAWGRRSPSRSDLQLSPLSLFPSPHNSRSNRQRRTVRPTERYVETQVDGSPESGRNDVSRHFVSPERYDPDGSGSPRGRHVLRQQVPAENAPETRSMGGADGSLRVRVPQSIVPRSSAANESLSVDDWRPRDPSREPSPLIADSGDDEQLQRALLESAEEEELRRAVEESKALAEAQEEAEKLEALQLVSRYEKPVTEFSRAIKANMGELASLGKPIEPTGYASLEPGQDISSDIVNCFFALLSRLSPSAQTVSTFFREYLSTWHEPMIRHPQLIEEAEIIRAVTYAASRLKKYASLIDWDSRERPFVLIPVYLPGHWTLAIVDLEKCRCEFWDSLHMHAGESVAGFDWWRGIFSEFVREFAPQSFQERCANAGGFSFTFANREKIHQTSGNDCGAFIMFYALLRAFARRSLSDVVDDPRLTPEMMIRFRQVVAKLLLPFVNFPA